MSGAMNRHCIPGLIQCPQPWSGTSRECPGILKRTQGLARTRIALAQRPVLTRKKPDVMI